MVDDAGQRFIDESLRRVDRLYGEAEDLLADAERVKRGLPPRVATSGQKKVYDALELYDADIPAPEGHLAGGLLCPNSIAMLAGRRGVGKTFLLLKLGAAIALGQSFGQYPTKTGKVLLLSEEMVDAEVRQRLRQMFPRETAEQLKPMLHIACKTGLKIDTPNAIREMASFVGSQGGVNVLLLDAFSDFKGSIPENDNDRVGEGARGLRDVVATELNCAVLVAHHMGRQKEDGSSNPRGASALEDACADIVHLGKSRSGEGHTGKFEKVRHMSPPAGFGYSIVDSGTGGVEIDVHEDREASSEAEEIQRVIAWLATKGEATLQETQDAMRWTKTTALGHLGQARTLGLVQRFKLMGEYVWALPSEEKQAGVPF